MHCDLNSFYVSVEMVIDPSLRGKAVVVCGKTEDRHGIVLAKSESAKKCGIKTGDVVWQAKNKCPDLIVLPPNFDEYVKYSKAVKQIYYRYTDLIEPFGLDECWLDVTGSERAFGTAYEIAYSIKETVKSELGLTISVGSSFNKTFAKLGSDMKKPDAITEINRDDFKDKAWRLPANEMLWVGRSTYKTLLKYGIITIGDLAKSKPSFLKNILGKNGLGLWQCANGLECSSVCDFFYTPPVKSIGRGITCVENLENNDEVWRVILTLSHNVSRHLRKEHLTAEGIQLSIKNSSLITSQSQAKLILPTQNSWEIAVKAQQIFVKNYNWNTPVRAVTVRAIDLVSDDLPQQLNLNFDMARHERLESLDKTMLELNQKYGGNTIFEATVLNGTKMPTEKNDEVLLPSAIR